MQEGCIAGGLYGIRSESHKDRADTFSEGDVMAKRKKTLLDFYEMKRRGEKITFLTAYDFPTAQFAEEAGLDMLLVGDSLGMCVYGYSGTTPVTMEQMIYHADAVRRGAPNTFVVGDMPFMSYQSSVEKAVENAGRFLKECDCDAIKLEGGIRVTSQIKAIVDAGIVVMGHIGLTPQSSGQLGGHKAQGRTAESAKLLVEDALAVQEAGAHMLLLEAVPPEVGKYITETLEIPVLSIGAGPHCDGQLLIVSDAIGQFQAFTPKFVKKYCNVAEVVIEAMKEYVKEVKAREFPRAEHCYTMLPGEEERFMEMMAGR
jgi:3-methyl-2-oxobutanoate hydroxymethyltransferase